MCTVSKSVVWLVVLPCHDKGCRLYATRCRALTSYRGNTVLPSNSCILVSARAYRKSPTVHRSVLQTPKVEVPEAADQLQLCKVTRIESFEETPSVYARYVTGLKQFVLRSRWILVKNSPDGWSGGVVCVSGRGRQPVNLNISCNEASSRQGHTPVVVMYRKKPLHNSTFSD